MHHNFHSTPTCTLKSRHESTSANHSAVTTPNQAGSFPGPSDYHYDKVHTKAPTYAIGTAKRDVFDGERENPGPGAYQLKSTIDVVLVSFRMAPESRSVSAWNFP